MEAKEIGFKVVKKRKILYLVGWILFLLFIVLVFFGVKISFLITEELTILLTPLDKSIITTYDKPVNITFEFENKNSFFCESACSYEFVDIGHGKILDTNASILSSKTKVVREYLLMPSSYGSGQEIFLFRVSCHNVKSLVCSTDEQEYIKSSFVTLSYDLSPEEKDKVSELNTQLNVFLTRANSFDIAVQELRVSQKALSEKLHETLFEKDIQLVESETLALENKRLALENFSKSLVTGWEDNAYSSIEEQIRLSDLGMFEISLGSAVQEASLLKEQYSTLVHDLQLIKESSSYLDAITWHYIEVNDTLLLQQSIDAKQEILEMPWHWKNTTYEYSSFKGDVASYQKKFEVIQEGLNLSALNQSIILNLSLSDFNIEKPVFISTIQTGVNLKEPTCCVFGECRTCCAVGVCSNDERLYPVIFLHGHAFSKKTSPEYSLNVFAKMQEKFQEEGIINAGQIDLQNLDDVPPGEYGRSGNPISLRATYYYIHYYDIGSYRITTQKSERIENYALRLNEIINLAKERTGSSKVNIVTHSMGGLVSREYMRLFGDGSVNKLIEIATPNYGISGRTADVCDVLGSQRECEDMKEGSIFMKRLNQANSPQQAKVYTIAGIGCPVDNSQGDGVIKQQSVPLPFATNYNVTGVCTDVFKANFHDNMVDPEKVPEIYDIVKNIFESNYTASM